MKLILWQWLLQKTPNLGFAFKIPSTQSVTEIKY